MQRQTKTHNMDLSIMQWNASENRYELRNFLLKTKGPPDIICIQKTLLRNKTGTPKLDDYVIGAYCVKIIKITNLRVAWLS